MRWLWQPLRNPIPTRFPFASAVTHPTKSIFSMLLADFVKLNKGAGDEGLFTEKDLKAALERTELIDFHQEVDVDGIKITPYRAGHVLGACMFMVDVAGLRVLYTGDYSRKPYVSNPKVTPLQHNFCSFSVFL